MSHQKTINSYFNDTSVVGSLPSSDIPGDLFGILDPQKIVEIKDIDTAFFEKIIEDPIYQEKLEHYNKRQKKLVDNAILEVGQNMLLHGLKSNANLDISSTDVTSKISINKLDKEGYDEIEIVTENLFEKEEINQTGGGIDTFLKRIDNINQKSSEDLEVEYKKELEQIEHNTHGGANLGFLDIARKVKKMYEKAANIFKAVITPINDHISKLTMIVKIPLPKPV